MFAADVSHSGAAFRLPHCPQDLLFCMSLVRHLRVLLVLAPEDHACRFKLNLSMARFSGFGSERSSGETPRWIKFAALAAFVLSSANHFLPAGRLKLERFAVVFQRTDSKLAWLLLTSEAVA